MTTIAAKNRTVGIRAALFGLAMLGLAFASVPLYRVFCAVTGFGGTTMRADAAPGAVAGEIGVRFDANIDPALPWKFEPEQGTVRIHPGARTVVAYRATNLTARSTSGEATFNVSPAVAGQYFSKIECFCFTEQTLRPGQSVNMPVVFFVDPKLRTDPATRDIDEITLSYTFYPVENPASGG
ncbi:cytochrome c oxidase assembly protein [Sphingomonas sp. LY29]|uniref:cytochrome c oxidase assembly protein n=1 Tax=unclassified Sphingomonas TaxID=196159 RepID=UPI002ADECF4A|nr:MULTISPECIES: cytochrome c oxidase assembly protein [unclassified Sphingomonas]MEA1072200.1 cytochrome c oxidase assembly protein [Sphingomonas sp. LY160]WRP25128.1 cytochrome c oxidase assembly protein [Sphingomonas sp. LY29]